MDRKTVMETVLFNATAALDRAEAEAHAEVGLGLRPLAMLAESRSLEAVVGDELKAVFLVGRFLLSTWLNRYCPDEVPNKGQTLSLLDQLLAQCRKLTCRGLDSYEQAASAVLWIDRELKKLNKAAPEAYLLHVGFNQQQVWIANSWLNRHEEVSP